MPWKFKDYKSLRTLSDEAHRVRFRRVELISKIERPVGRRVCDWTAANSRSIRCTRHHKYGYGGDRMDNYDRLLTVSIIN